MSNAVSRRYQAYFKFNREGLVLFERRLADALNYLTKEGLAGSEAAMSANVYGRLIELGIEFAELEMGAEFDTSEPMVIQSKLREIERAEARKSHLVQIYESMGLDGFVAWCKEQGIGDWAQVLEEYSMGLFQQNQNKPWSEKAAEWLSEHLGDGKAHSVDEIKREAAIKGIIGDDDPEADWSKLKVLASRHGYSGGGRRGWWREPD